MASLDMSLDDMIKNRRNAGSGRGRGTAPRGRGQGGSFGGGRSTGPPRRGPLRVNARPSAYTIAQFIESGFATQELFSEIGELKRYAIHFDQSGRPSGSAEVMFVLRSDAFQALKRYNNVELDGKPMIEVVGSKSEVTVSAHVNVVGGLNGQRTVVMIQRIRGGTKNSLGVTTNGRGGACGRGRGQRGGCGRGGRKKPAFDKSADELDKELENYHAMQT